VTPYIWKNPEIFKKGHVFNLKNDLSHFRWTVDEERDLRFVREVYNRLYLNESMFYTDDVLKLLAREPDLIDINMGIIRNEGYQKSLQKDELIH